MNLEPGSWQLIAGSYIGTRLAINNKVSMREPVAEEKTYCYYHPDVETGVRCSNCGKLICPKDMVFTPVGVKCPECARPVGRMAAGPPPIYYFRAAAAGLGAALVGGLALALLKAIIPFGGFLLALFFGYGIGEAVSWGARRNVGLGFQIIAVVSAVVGFIVGGYLLGPVIAGRIVFPPGLIDLFVALIGIGVAVARLRE